MESGFWIKRWKENQIGFHQEEINPFLKKYAGELNIKGKSIFVPLCGKTFDILWLAKNSHKVVGVELVESAVKQFFKELGVEPKVEVVKGLNKYSYDNIEIFAGDFFRLSREILGVVDVVYDRAALIALPEEMRARYSERMVELTQKAPQLILTYTYDVTQMQGPPFSIGEKELKAEYQKDYEIQLLEVVDTTDGIKSVSVAKEHAWHLVRKGC